VQSEPQAPVLGGGEDRDVYVAMFGSRARGRANRNSHTAASCSSNAASTIRRNSSIARLRTMFMLMLKSVPSARRSRDL